ncbi:MAG: LytR C-terminal domain-containing protein [Gemmatimonadales bacterium]
MKRALVGVVGVVLTLTLLGALVRGGRGDLVPGHAWPIPAGPDRSIVEVMNGTPIAGLARVGTRILRQHGIDVIFFGNADSAADSTRIIIRRGDPARAALIRKALGTGIVSVAIDTLRRVDATVILGEDFKAPAGIHP